MYNNECLDLQTTCSDSRVDYISVLVHEGVFNILACFVSIDIDFLELCNSLRLGRGQLDLETVQIYPHRAINIIVII